MNVVFCLTVCSSHKSMDLLSFCWGVWPGSGCHGDLWSSRSVDEKERERKHEWVGRHFVFFLFVYCTVAQVSCSCLCFKLHVLDFGFRHKQSLNYSVYSSSFKNTVNTWHICKHAAKNALPTACVHKQLTSDHMITVLNTWPQNNSDITLRIQINNSCTQKCLNTIYHSSPLSGYDTSYLCKYSVYGTIYEQIDGLDSSIEYSTFLTNYTNK